LGLGVLYPPVQILGVWRHVARSEPCLVHPKTDRLDGIWLTRRRPCALLAVSILYASEVQILSIVKYASMPSGEQTRGMRSMSAHVACRVSLGVQQGVGFARRELSERWKFIRQVAMEKHLTAWRELPDTPWLKDSPRSAQNKAIEDLDRALKNFFEQHAVCPRFPTQRPVRRSLPVAG
jgi:hypothetical protein